MLPKIKTFSEYAELAKKTSSTIGTHWHNRLLHAAIGLASEIPEVRKAQSSSELVKEYGDMYWYLAEACNAIEFFPSLEDHKIIKTIPVASIEEAICLFCDRAKRCVYYNQSQDLQESIIFIAYKLQNAIHRMGYIPEIIWRANIEKLSKRYPEGFFTYEAAVVRADGEPL